MFGYSAPEPFLLSIIISASTSPTPTSQQTANERQTNNSTLSSTTTTTTPHTPKMDSTTRASMDSQKRSSQDSSARRPSDTTRFSKITDMKRSPTNDNATARRASWEEQTIPRGAGVLGDMWNKFARGTETKK